MLPILKLALAKNPRTVSRAPCQQIVLRGSDIDLARIPIQSCWPGEPAPLITFPLVVTATPGGRPEDANLGVYRMQVTGRDTTLMRWLAHRGGAQHMAAGGAKGASEFPVAAVIGADPATTMAAVTPIPDNVSEYAFAGLLRGIPHEYVAYNVPPDESQGRLAEAIDIIVKAWTEPEPFGWEGEYYQYRAVSIWPRPMQKPHPRIMMSCSNEASARVAAQKRAMFGLANLQTFDNARMLMKVYRDEAKACGWEPTPDDFVIALTASVDEDADLAKDRLTEGRRYFAKVLGGGLRTAQQIVLQKTRYMDDDTRSKFQGANKQAAVSVDDLIDAGIVICGTPETAVAQIKRAHAELGMGTVNINMKVGNIPDAAIVNQIKIFGEQILPQVKGL